MCLAFSKLGDQYKKCINAINNKDLIYKDHLNIMSPYENYRVMLVKSSKTSKINAHLNICEMNICNQC